MACGLMVLLLPEVAMAWGPGVHIGLGRTVLDCMHVLPAAVAAVLAKHTLGFLYGNIAADIVFAKRLSCVKQFCHHWSTAFGLVRGAKNDQAKAFAYGYLSHLAADTVAHGKFVPRQLALSHMSVNAGHFLWELRADVMEPASSRKLLEEILGASHAAEHDTLARHLGGAFLPYDLNRALFHHISALVVRQSVQRGLRIWNECSRWYLSPALIDQYRSECVDRILSILDQGERSALLMEDPNGTSALMQVSVRRRETRRLKRCGVDVHARTMETSRGWAPGADRYFPRRNDTTAAAWNTTP